MTDHILDFLILKIKRKYLKISKKIKKFAKGKFIRIEKAKKYDLTILKAFKDKSLPNTKMQ